MSSRTPDSVLRSASQRKAFRLVTACSVAMHACSCLAGRTMSYGRLAMSAEGAGRLSANSLSSDSSAMSSSCSISSLFLRSSVALRDDCSRSSVGASSSSNFRSSSSSWRSCFCNRASCRAPNRAWSFTRFCASLISSTCSCSNALTFVSSSASATNISSLSKTSSSSRGTPSSSDGGDSSSSNPSPPILIVLGFGLCRWNSEFSRPTFATILRALVALVGLTNFRRCPILFLLAVQSSSPFPRPKNRSAPRLCVIPAKRPEYLACRFMLGEQGSLSIVMSSTHPLGYTGAV
mmetsp:Transcript_15487/g.33506  ORF Transcript_15487/g.33506 Transcript_15487/m.33506 type:complete len:292 (+) Transcript_15487:355-1230(+)